MTSRLSIRMLATYLGRPLPTHLVSTIEALDTRLSEPDLPRFTARDLARHSETPPPVRVSLRRRLHMADLPNRHERRKAAALARHGRRRR